MNKIRLIITADYEIFGDGSGDVQNCMIEPTNRIMDICDKYGAKLTLFIDVCEYWAFERKYLEKHPDFLKTTPHLKIKKQLQNAVKRGHDVQLHLHPQWLDAVYKNKKWQLNYQYWRLPNVENHPEWNLEKLFKKGKETLESIIREVKEDYSCDVFRAGAWCIQPEEKVLLALINNGFKIDSTVTPNKGLNDGLNYFDFNGVEKKPSWKITNDIKKEDKNGALTEIPIFTTKVSAKEMFYFNYLKVKRKIPNYPDACKREPKIKKNKLVNKIFTNMQSQIRMLNFCDAVPFEEMKFITEKAIETYQKYLVKGPQPLVMIGHPKTFGNPIEFEKYLEWVKSYELLKFDLY